MRIINRKQPDEELHHSCILPLCTLYIYFVPVCTPALYHFVPCTPALYTCFVQRHFIYDDRHHHGSLTIASSNGLNKFLLGCYLTCATRRTVAGSDGARRSRMIRNKDEPLPWTLVFVARQQVPRRRFAQHAPPPTTVQPRDCTA